jgi:hypothetical protein
VALGWRDGVLIEEFPIIIEAKDGLLVERIDPAGRPMRIVTRIDAARFNQFWLDTLTGPDRQPSYPAQ